MTIHAMEVYGNWDEGYVLDFHTVNSVYLGEDENGHPLFDTTRSTLGELVYSVKYQSKYEHLDAIEREMAPFVSETLSGKAIECVVPVPPSKYRSTQPVFEIAKRVAKLLNTCYSEDILNKQAGSVQAKGMSAEEKAKLSGSVFAAQHATRAINVLLVDDLYQSGTTLRECVRALRRDPFIQHIYVLAMTKTKK